MMILCKEAWSSLPLLSPPNRLSKDKFLSTACSPLAFLNPFMALSGLVSVGCPSPVRSLIKDRYGYRCHPNIRLSLLIERYAQVERMGHLSKWNVFPSSSPSILADTFSRPAAPLCICRRPRDCTVVIPSCFTPCSEATQTCLSDSSWHCGGGGIVGEAEKWWWGVYGGKKRGR